MSIPKNIQKHPEYAKMAKKTDDLQYILLTYGSSLGPKALKSVQEDFKRSDRKFERLCKVLEAQGYRAYL